MESEDSKVDLIKKRKDVHLTENLDNTASVDKILDVLQTTLSKNKVGGLYCHTVRQRLVSDLNRTTAQHYLVPSHPLNAFSDDWDGGLNSGYFEQFSHRSLLPRIISTVKNIGVKDPVTDYLSRKEKWHAIFVDFKTASHAVKVKNLYKWIDDSLMYCSKQLVDMAVHYANNPDRYFEATYNWYYAGHGNMQQLSLAGKDYMLQSVLTCFYIHEFTKYNLQMDYENIIATFNCRNEIHETIISTQNIIALRTRNNIFILKLLESDGSLKLEKINELESEMPFTGISFDEHHKNILYVTNLDYKLTIVNLDRMSGRTKQLKGNVITLVDNWSRVIGTERGYFTHVSKFALTLYDKRTNLAFQRWRCLKRISDTRHCNEISVAQHCEKRPFLYFGTSHHVILLDLRYKESEDNSLKAVQRWSHGMQCAPLYMTLSKLEPNKDLICLSSQWCEDMCVLSNYNERPTRDFNVRSVTMPYRPPSILQALNEAKQKRLCCDFLNPIDKRLCTAITGLSVVEQGDNYHILMLNSLGDMTSHNLCPRHMTNFFEDDSIELLHEWSKGYKREIDDFEVTSILDISNVWKQLKRIPDSYVFGEDILSKKYRKFNEDEIYEAFKNEEIEAGLLEIWNKNDYDKETNKDTIDAEDTKEETTLHLFFSEEE